MKHTLVKAALAGLCVAGVSATSQAAEILVNSDIAVDETWTKNNTYNLQDQIYVLPGATLTIEAGTVVASTTNIGGSLAVAKGAQIHVLGTKDEPVIMTSTADVATWVGGDSETGTWREAANEWGNLTIMGCGYISENATPGNVPTPDCNNVAQMEGLVRGGSIDQYGGCVDDDDSGTLNYLSIRYGGRVINLNNELNGLSLGGVGSETDIDYVEIMNNVDDGIEIWGGCVDLRHFSIWNVGDDSLDIDQGWRGRAQNGLIVQGYSLDAGQGSGVGDNCFETDGAEDSDWQPVTSTTIYNCTVIGQPVDGDQGTAWRDNARVQYRNCIFMDLGDELVKFDNDDGDGANGYGHNGTTSWADTWILAYDQYSTVNAPSDPASFYKAQFDGNLAEMRDCVFFRNLNSDAYDEATARGVFDPAFNNTLIAGFDDSDSPVVDVQRGPPVVRGTKTMLPVTFLDPRPANEAVSTVGFAPDDGFWDSSKWAGAFRPGHNWLSEWTASEAFGFTASDFPWCDLGEAKAGTHGDPILAGRGPLTAGSTANIDLSAARASSPAFLVIGLSRIDAPFSGGTLVPAFDLKLNLSTNGSGEINLAAPWPAGVTGFDFYFQFVVGDPVAEKGLSLSNALQATGQ